MDTARAFFALPEMSHFKRLRISIEDKTSSDLTPYFKTVAIFIHKGKFISFCYNKRSYDHNLFMNSIKILPNVNLVYGLIRGSNDAL